MRRWVGGALLLVLSGCATQPETPVARLIGAWDCQTKPRVSETGAFDDLKSRVTFGADGSYRQDFDGTLTSPNGVLKMKMHVTGDWRLSEDATTLHYDIVDGGLTEVSRNGVKLDPLLFEPAMMRKMLQPGTGKVSLDGAKLIISNDVCIRPQ